MIKNMANSDDDQNALQSAESQLKVKPELAETVCHYSGLRYNRDDGHNNAGDDCDGDAGGDDANDDDHNLSPIHWAVKHNNRRLLER